jgi:mono/diheme cytochrome c family protein
MAGRRQSRWWIGARSGMLTCAIGLTVSAKVGAADEAKAGRDVTFAKDIAPIFQEKCQRCHHPGTVAPMSLMTYEETRPWVSAIKRRVAQREMPPWGLDMTVGITEIENVRALTDEQIDKIVRWAGAGAPLGNPADLPRPLVFQDENIWDIGKPDLVVSFPKDHVMYPKGSDWWINYFADTGLTEDRWIKAMATKPGSRQIVHHAIAYLIEKEPPPEVDPDQGSYLLEYSLGKTGEVFQENTGRLLPAGSRIRWDMHYFAIGKEVTDRTSTGFVFWPRGYVPKYKVTPFAFRNLPNEELDVPPNSMARTDAYYHVKRPMMIVGFQPHMHIRGKAQTLEAINPNDTITVISSVNRFNFGWHTQYFYKDGYQPLLPAGTVLHSISIHDNTAANPLNPDPTIWLGYGERSVDDMAQTRLNIVYLTDQEYKELADQRKGKQATTNQQQQ